tara:strand:- start:2899 stop:3006 length:108 start_codon:yes stop_codon:yes gene_type:complete
MDIDGADLALVVDAAPRDLEAGATLFIRVVVPGPH